MVQGQGAPVPSHPFPAFLASQVRLRMRLCLSVRVFTTQDPSLLSSFRWVLWQVEIAVTRALAGKPVTNRGALANPASLNFFSSPECLRLLDELKTE